jgi:hypothetical protein
MKYFFKGAWKPSLNIQAVLLSVLLLLVEPNPDDALIAEIVIVFIIFNIYFYTLNPVYFPAYYCMFVQYLFFRPQNINKVEKYI